jgi:hypothetical protein
VVTDDVTPLQQAELIAAADGDGAGVAVDHGEDVLGVGPERVEGDEELPGDRGTGEVDVEKAQDRELSFAERVGRDPRTAGATSAGEAAGNVSAACMVRSPHRRRMIARASSTVPGTAHNTQVM